MSNDHKMYKKFFINLLRLERKKNERREENLADDSESQRKSFIFLRTSEKFTFILACNGEIKTFIIKSILERGGEAKMSMVTI